jgi:8-oxo-dGTP pyrophosphatase MutT (NUDIX family)
VRYSERRVDLSHFAAKLAAHRPEDTSDFLVRSRAAVAVVLRWRGDAGPDVLLMTRAERAGDRWSGHVSMPGGRAEPEDASLLATAIRETREELGVELRDAPVLGRLGAVKAIARGRVLPMTITPFVFHLPREQPLALSAEAVEAFWLPLDRAARGELDAPYVYKLAALPLTFPSWRWEGRVVWGLTYQMLTRLLKVVGAGTR